MFELLRMDIRRMARAKMLYISLASLVAGVLITAAVLRTIVDPSAGLQSADKAAMEILGLTDVQALCSTIYSGSFFFLALYMVAALFVCSDYSSGFAKNIFTVHADRWKYYVSKLVCSAIVCAFLILGTFAGFKLINFAMGFQYAPSPSDYLLFLAANLLVGAAFSAQAIFVAVATRSSGAGVGLAIVAGSGMVVVMLESILGNWGISIIDSTIYGCTQGVAGYFNRSNPIGHYMIVAAVWLLVWSVLSIVVLYRRDAVD